MTEHPIAVWHRLVKERNPRGLDALLDAEAVFHSPVMHRTHHRIQGHAASAQGDQSRPSAHDRPAPGQAVNTDSDLSPDAISTGER